MAIYKGTNKVINIKKKLLPSEYQQVEYIYKIDNAPWIDTGRKANLNTKAEVKFKYNILPNSTSIIVGARGTSSTTNAFVLGITSGHEYYARFGNGAPTENRQPYDTDIHIATNSIDGGYLDDIKIATYSTQSSYETPYSVALFASRENDGTITFNAISCRIYYYKVWESDILVQDLIPCYRKSDSEIGFYDLVNGVFYTNQGTGAFRKGNDILPNVKSVIKGGNFGYTKLPSGYQKCEYIESSGLEYIDTGVIPTNNTEVDADFVVVNFNSNVVNYMFGNYEVGKLFALYRSASDIFGVMFSNYDNFSSYQIQLNTRYKAKLNNTGAYINGSSIKDFTNLPDFTATNSLYIFKGNGSSRPPAILKLYGFTIKESNKVIRKLIPCYRVSDTTIGLYDIVNNVFYTNAGTGAFTKGNDVV